MDNLEDLLYLIVAAAVPYLCVRFIAWFVLGGSLVATGIYLWAMNQRLRGPGWQEPPPDARSAQPAYKQYFFRKAFHDYALIVKSCFSQSVALHRMANGLGHQLQKSRKHIVQLLGVELFATTVLAQAAVCASHAALAAIHLVILTMLCLLALVLAMFLRATEQLSMMMRQIFLVCPHRGCWKQVALPVYICPGPGCFKKHTRLLPGLYGIFQRRCACGQLLPTLSRFGRSKLEAECPHPQCHRPWNSAIGAARNIHIALVGGPGAGKTSFLMASMVELQRQAASGAIALDFPDKRRDAPMFERCRQMFASGTVVFKTGIEPPDAFLVDLVNARRKRVLLYTYDLAGELYQQFDSLRKHHYFTYTHGIIFLIDPFSLPDIQESYRRQLADTRTRVKPSAEQPQHVYDRMVGTLRDLTRKRGKLMTPLAVVVTKADAFGLQDQISGTPAPPLPGSAPDRAHVDSLRVRRWLEDHGERNLVQCIENDFQSSLFFCCSSLGRLPDDTRRPFAPQDVLTPFGWALGRRRMALPE